MTISLWVSLVILFIGSIMLDQLMRWVDRAQPGHPLGPGFMGVFIIFTLVVVYMVDGFTVSELACGHDGWMRWDHIIAGFAVSGTPLVVGTLVRYVRG